jgi:hypothetical protein
MYLIQSAHVMIDMGGHITPEDTKVAHVDPARDPDPGSEAARCGPQSRSCELS